MNQQLLQSPTPEVKKTLVGQGVSYLKMFHDDYNRNRESRSMEYQRGIVTGWRFTLDLLYGERVGEEIANAASEEANLTIPPAAGVDNNGEWFGFDSRAHTYIGKLHE
jgi:hypothetical protein